MKRCAWLNYAWVRAGYGYGCTHVSSSSSNPPVSSSSNLYENPEQPPGSTERRSICLKAGSSMPLRTLSWTMRCVATGATGQHGRVVSDGHVQNFWDAALERDYCAPT
jgi:hypothetical protein